MKATFGTTVRAARMGYHPIDGIGFVRILAGGPPWEINIRPFDDMPVEKKSTEHHVWWEQEDGRRQIEETIRCHIHSEVTKPRVLFLNDDGEP
jgi:hypothetical protein